MGQEIELKLGLCREDQTQFASVTTLEKARPLASRQLINIYFDTPERDLARQKMAVRIREDAGRYIQTLKTAGNSAGGLSVRGEWEWDLDAPTLDLVLLRDVLLARGESCDFIERLEPVFETNFERQLWMVEDEQVRSSCTIEIALDRGQIITPDGRTEPLHELELELKLGSAECLFATAEEIARQIPVYALDISKAQRGYMLADGCAEAAQLRMPEPQDDPNAMLVELIGTALKVWPAQLELAAKGQIAVLPQLLNTLDTLLAALNGVPDIVEHCQILISQYQRLRAEVAAAADYRLIPGMSVVWQGRQQAIAQERIQVLRNKTLPGQLALTTAELLWQIQDE